MATPPKGGFVYCKEKKKKKNNSKFLASKCYNLLQISALWEMDISGQMKKTSDRF
jgi:hypothetical protein